MAFTTTTRSTLRTRISERLISSFWTTAELNAYINEALRVWNALTGYKKNFQNATIPTVTTAVGAHTLAQMTGSSTTAMFLLRLENSDNNTTITPLKLSELGYITPAWLSTTPGTTEYWTHIGQNKVVLYPRNTATFTGRSYTIDMITVPTADANNIQVGEEDMPAIIDYCVFIARLKEGGKEFQESVGLLQNFLRHASRYNGMILQTALYKKVMGFPAQKRARPPYLEHLPPR